MSGGYWNVQIWFAAAPTLSHNPPGGPSGAGDTDTVPRPPSTLVTCTVSVRGPRNDASTSSPGPGNESGTWHGSVPVHAPDHPWNFESGCADTASVTTVSGGYWNVQTWFAAAPTLSHKPPGGPSGAGDTDTVPRPPSRLVSCTLSVRGPRNDASTSSPGPGNESGTWHGSVPVHAPDHPEELRIRMRRHRQRHHRVRRVLERADLVRRRPHVVTRAPGGPSGAGDNDTVPRPPSRLVSCTRQRPRPQERRAHLKRLRHRDDTGTGAGAGALSSPRKAEPEAASETSVTVAPIEKS